MKSTSQQVFAYVVALPVPATSVTETVIVAFKPDYKHMLSLANAESAIPITQDAVIRFGKLFFRVAHMAEYDAVKIHSLLNTYVQDIEYLLGIGIQKVHQAWTLRKLLLQWLETVHLLIRYAEETINAVG